MRRTIVAAVVAAALVGAGASAAVTGRDDDGWSHPMMSDGQLAGHLGGRTGGLGGHMAGFGTGHHVAAASEQEYLAEMVAHHQEAIDAARELRRSDRADPAPLRREDRRDAVGPGRADGVLAGGVVSR